MTKILICGCVNWNDTDYIRKILEHQPKDSIFIHGNLSGVEAAVNFYCKFIGLQMIINDKYNLNYYSKKRDYSMRSYLMINEEKPNKIIIIDNNYESNDAYDFIKKISKDNIEILLIKSINFS